MIDLVWVGAFLLLGLGIYGLLVVRQLIKVAICLQILGKAAVLVMVAASAQSGQVNLGQSLAVSILVADTLAVVVVLALATQLHHYWGTLDITEFATLQED